MSSRRVLTTCSALVSALIRRGGVLLQAVAFWAAIVLPALHIPLLVVGSPRDVSNGTVGLLIALNLAAVVVGHGYDGIV